MNQRIVVLGAGYAGLTCFLELQSRLPPGANPVLVNGGRYHWFTTELHTYVAGEQADTVRVPLRRLVGAPDRRLVVDRVLRIDPEQQQVTLESGTSLPYDWLVIALGSDPEFYGLPGVQEHALVVGSWEGAVRLRQRLQQLMAAPRPPHLVVVGGGLTGVEVAAELADRYDGRVRVTLLEAGPEIMSGFGPELVQTAREVLAAKGIRIRTGTPITGVEAEAIHLKDADWLSYDLLVWAAGVRGSHLLAEAGLPVTKRGRAMVDAFLRSLGDDRIYVIGDAAAVAPEGEQEVPPTAQAAVQMGRTAARNLLRRLKGRAEEPFQYRSRGAIASLGWTEGVGQVGSEQLVGMPAMMAKELIAGHHAWGAGSGLMPLVHRLLRLPRRRWVNRSFRLAKRTPAPTPERPRG